MAPRRGRVRGRGRGKHQGVSSTRPQSSSPQSQAFMSNTPPLQQQQPQIGDRDLSSQFEDTKTWTSSSGSVNFEDMCSPRTWGPGGVSMQPERGRGSTSMKPRRGRGPSKGQSLKRHVQEFGKINVEIRSETMRPIDSVVATKLPRECTHIVRTHAPLKNKRSWKDVNENEKQPLYAQLQKSFNIKDMDAPHVHQCIEEYFANTYHRFRSYCHAHYHQVKESGVDPRQHSYQDVLQEDWEFLCDHFESESFKKRSAANKSNRGKLEFSHCMGPKSFVTALNERENSKANQQLDQIDFFARTHTNQKTGKFCSPAAQAKYEKMKEMQEKVQEGEYAMTQDQIFDEVMGGKSGYVKGLGQGPKPTKQKLLKIALWKETQELRERVAAQDELIKSLQREKEEQAKHLEEMCANQAQLEEQAKQLEEMRTRQAQLEASFHQIMQQCVMYGARTSSFLSVTSGS